MKPHTPRPSDGRCFHCHQRRVIAERHWDERRWAWLCAACWDDVQRQQAVALVEDDEAAQEDALDEDTRDEAAEAAYWEARLEARRCGD